MPCYLCETCGTQYADTPEPPTRCRVCDDERQYVGWQGQRWATHDDLARRFTLRIGDDDGLLGIALPGEFAIPQRALLLPTDAGNILWECISLVTPEAVAALQARGGVDLIAISHPHFYSAMVEWSNALGGVPILLHEADREWVMRPAPQVEFWRGDSKRLSAAVTLVRCGGHFAGSTALHWANGPTPGGALFPGDALQVASDRRHVGFMYSYPNYIPMKPGDVRAMRERLAPFDFEQVFGFSWGRNITRDGRAAVDASFNRFFHAIGA
ncbi:MBL fold metallo-hydrolase [Ideonella sp.]|uniref:MBL fold metallo-hydrolase n=1 Tax=Ideonella sp. TaxID=1929293 RepID=UPI0035B2796F